MLCYIRNGMKRKTGKSSRSWTERENYSFLEITISVSYTHLYRPNAAGKALAARKKSFIIGVILCARGNEFFDDILKGIKGAEQEASEFGIQVQVMTMKGYQVEEQLRLRCV